LKSSSVFLFLQNYKNHHLIKKNPAKYKKWGGGFENCGQNVQNTC